MAIAALSIRGPMGSPRASPTPLATLNEIRLVLLELNRICFSGEVTRQLTEHLPYMTAIFLTEETSARSSFLLKTHVNPKFARYAYAVMYATVTDSITMSALLDRGWYVFVVSSITEDTAERSKASPMSGLGVKLFLWK